MPKLPKIAEIENQMRHHEAKAVIWKSVESLRVLGKPQAKSQNQRPRAENQGPEQKTKVHEP
jgi:hypothetical protein